MCGSMHVRVENVETLAKLAFLATEWLVNGGLLFLLIARRSFH